MADSLKRITWAKDKQNQDRVDYYLFQKALAVMALETPGADDLAFAKMIYVGSHNLLACAKVVVSNTTIGAKIDVGTAVPDSDIEYVVMTEQWTALAGAAAQE